MFSLDSAPRWAAEVLRFAAVIAVALTVATVYTARGDSHDTTYHACLYAGSLTQVGTTPPDNCGRGTPVSWAAGAPPGVSQAYAQRTTLQQLVLFGYTDVLIIHAENLTTIETLDVPAGTYLVSAVLHLSNGNADPRQTTCTLTTSLDPNVDDRYTTELFGTPGTANQGPLALSATLTLDSPGAIELRCGVFAPLGEPQLGTTSGVQSVRAMLTAIPVERIN